MFALLPALLLLALLEGGARLLEPRDAVRQAEARSPVAFQLLPAPLFTEDPPGFLAPHEEAVDAHHLRIASPRPAGELRIVILGGSATAGWGLPPTASFVGRAERLLDGLVPDRRVRLINLARSGWGTAQIALAFDRVAEQLEPDLVVVIAGNNEYLDIANALALTDGGPTALYASRWLARSSAFYRRLLPAQVRPTQDAKSAEPTEAPPHPKLSQVPAPERMQIYAARRLHRNLRRIRATAERVGAPMILTTLAVNERFSVFDHPLWLADQEGRDRRELREVLLPLFWGRPDLAAPALASLAQDAADPGIAALAAAALDDPGDHEAARALAMPWLRRWAYPVPDELPTMAANYRIARAMLLKAADGALQSAPLQLAELGWIPMPRSDDGADCHAAEALLAAGAVEEARAEFERCLPQVWLYRADRTINDQLRASAIRLGLPLIDLQATVRAAAPDRIPGWETFWDYCHYNPAGSVLMAHALAEGLRPRLAPAAPPLDPVGALAAFRAAWVERRFDGAALEDWVGVDEDVARAIDRGQGEPLGRTPAPGLMALWRGNRAASEAGPGRGAAAEEAERHWRAALAEDPAWAGVVDGNRELLRWMVGEPR